MVILKPRISGREQLNLISFQKEQQEDIIAGNIRKEFEMLKELGIKESDIRYIINLRIREHSKKSGINLFKIRNMLQLSKEEYAF